MYQVGDLVIYSAHGLCKIDDICEKTLLGTTQPYYVLHPVEDPDLLISVPVHNDKVKILKIMDRQHAIELIESFTQPGIDWIERTTERNHKYSNIINTGNREDISKIVNTLMRKKHDAENKGKKLGEVDNRLLTSVQKILFTELAVSLDTTYEAISNKITDLIVNS